MDVADIWGGQTARGSERSPRETTGGSGRTAENGEAREMNT